MKYWIDTNNKIHQLGDMPYGNYFNYSYDEDTITITPKDTLDPNDKLEFIETHKLMTLSDLQKQLNK